MIKLTIALVLFTVFIQTGNCANFVRCYSCGSEWEECSSLDKVQIRVCVGRLNSCAIKTVDIDGFNRTFSVFCQAKRLDNCNLAYDETGKQQYFCVNFCEDHYCNKPLTNKSEHLTTFEAQKEQTKHYGISNSNFVLPSPLFNLIGYLIVIKFCGSLLFLKRT